MELIKPIALTTGSTENFLPNEADVVLVTGTETLSVSDFIIRFNTSATVNGWTFVKVVWAANATVGVNDVILFNKTLTAVEALDNFMMLVMYNGTDYHYVNLTSMSEANFIIASMMAADSVGTSAIIDKNVTPAKLGGLTAAQLLIGQAATDATATTVTGDVTISAGGVTAIGAAKVLKAMIGTGQIDYTLFEADEQKEVMNVNIDFHASPKDFKFRMPFPCEVDTIYSCVTEVIEATDAGTVQFKDHSGTNFTNGLVTLAAGATAGTAATLIPTGNNTFAAGEILTLTCTKTTVGATNGVVTFTLQLIRQ